MRYVTVCCCVLQSVAECCRVLQSVAACCSVFQCVAVCCSVSQYVAVSSSVLQCVSECCSVEQCGAVCCSVLQCVAACNAKQSARASTSVAAAQRCIAWGLYLCVYVELCRKAREEVLYRETGVAPPLPRPSRCQKRVRVDVGGDGVASHLLGCALEEVKTHCNTPATYCYTLETHCNTLATHSNAL